MIIEDWLALSLIGYLTFVLYYIPLRELHIQKLKKKIKRLEEDK